MPTKNLTAAEMIELKALDHKQIYGGLTDDEEERRIALGLQHVFSTACQDDCQQYVENVVDI